MNLKSYNRIQSMDKNTLNVRIEIVLTTVLLFYVFFANHIYTICLMSQFLQKHNVQNFIPKKNGNNFYDF